MTFLESIETCNNKKTTFQGRASRSEFWWWILATLLLNVIAVAISIVITRDFLLIFINTLLMSLVLLPPTFAVMVRRIHDSKHSGWWALCPIYNIVLMFFNSTPGTNDYGETTNNDILKYAEYFNLGQQYYFGDKGVKKDFHRAVYYFTKAAENGIAIAAYQLGKIYETGDGKDFPANQSLSFINTV